MGENRVGRINTPNLNRRAAKLYVCVETAFKVVVPWDGALTIHSANGSCGFRAGPKPILTQGIISTRHSLIRKWKMRLVEEPYSGLYFKRCQLYGYGRQRQIYV